jgi:hypothetical protein
MGSLHDDRRHALGVTDALQDSHAVDAGHYKVEEHEGNWIAILGFEDLEGLLAGTARLGFETETLDRLFESTPLGRIVIDDQNTLGHGHATLHLLTQGAAEGAELELTQLLTFGDRQITQQGRECRN